MPFTVKDWKDDPDHSTPVEAAALEDLETRLGAYTDTQVATKQDAATAATDAELAAGRPHSMDATDMGLLAWGYDAATATAASTPVAGTMYLTRMPVRETVTIGNIVLVISTPGTGATPLANCFAGVFDAAGTRRGVTADQSVPWASGTTKIMALTADGGQSLTIAQADGYYYVGFVVGTQATTAVQFFRSGSSAGPGQLGLTAASTPPARFMSKTGFAGGLPTSVVYNTCSVSSFLWWTGVAA